MFESVNIINGKTGGAAFSRLFLIGSFSCVHVTRTYMYIKA